MENQAFIDSLKREIIHPGVEQLMNSRYFTELRAGKLSKKRLAGFAMQHYHSKQAIIKGLACCMVKNASKPPASNYGLDSRARTFFIVHGKVDQEHTAMAAETIARNANTDRDKELVRTAARNMVRFKLAKFEGIYDAYA